VILQVAPQMVGKAEGNSVADAMLINDHLYTHGPSHLFVACVRTCRVSMELRPYITSSQQIRQVAAHCQSVASGRPITIPL
jgi:hypothetical protein